MLYLLRCASRRFSEHEFRIRRRNGVADVRREGRWLDEAGNAWSTYYVARVGVFPATNFFLARRRRVGPGSRWRGSGRPRPTARHRGRPRRPRIANGHHNDQVAILKDLVNEQHPRPWATPHPVGLPLTLQRPPGVREHLQRPQRFAHTGAGIRRQRQN